MIKRVTVDVLVGADYLSEYVLRCERCGKTIDAFDTFEKALAYANTHDWKNGFCPECRKEVER